MNFNQRLDCEGIQLYAFKLLIYIDSTLPINAMEYLFRVIRNEKVGCSIHLSGTNRYKGLLLLT